jgi:ribose transport system substrate-binding protein
MGVDRVGTLLARGRTMRTRSSQAQHLAAVLAISAIVVGACQAGASSSPSSAAPAGSTPVGSAAASSASAKNYQIALNLGVFPSAFGGAMRKGAETCAAEVGATVSMTAPAQAQPALQIALLDGVLAKKPDALIIQPDDATALVAPMKKFKDAGIVAFTIDTDVGDPSLRLGNITADNVKGGKVAADTMNQLLNGTGKVLYVGFVPGATTTDQRLQGWKSQLATYSGLVSVGEQFNQSNSTEAAAAVSAALTKNPDLAGIFASDQNSAIGTATAVQAAGKVGKVKIVAFDAAADEVTALKRGTLQSLIVQKPFDYGCQAAKFVVAYLKDGTQPPAQTYADYVIATPDNIDSPDVSKYLY